VATGRDDILGNFLDQMADAFIQRVMDRVNLKAGASARGGSTNGARGPSKLRGRKLDMRCRYPGCRNRSRGPRFHFLCEEHSKLPWTKAKAAIQKAAEKSA
jgi:hypothetical protein